MFYQAVLHMLCGDITKTLHLLSHSFVYFRPTQPIPFLIFSLLFKGKSDVCRAVAAFVNWLYSLAH